MKNKKQLICMTIFFVLNYQLCIPQVNDDHIMVNPYKNQVIGRTMGGATVALPDYAPLIYANPATIVSFQDVELFLSTNLRFGYIEPISSIENNIKSQDWRDDFDIETLAVSSPFKLLGRFYSIAASYNGIVPFNYKLQQDFYSTMETYHNQLKTTTVALGGKITSTIDIGLGWTHWFGRRIIKEKYSSESVSKLRARYSGEQFNFGIRQIVNKKISIGAVLYFPFRLFINNSNSEEFSFMEHENNYSQEQKVGSSTEIGFAYKINPSIKFGLGCGYQSKFILKSKSNSIQTEKKYRDLAFVSSGLEYKLPITKVSLPLFLMYKFQAPTTFDTDFATHIIDFGANIKLHHTSFFLAAYWEKTGKYQKFPPPLT